MAKITLFDFKYELPSGSIVTVYARHTPGLPERRPSLEHHGEPADEGEMEIEGCEFHGEKIDLADLCIDDPNSRYETLLLTDDIQKKAWEALEDE